MRYVFPKTYWRSWWFVAASLVILVVALAATMMSRFQADASSDGRGERRRVILVAGICSENPAQSMGEIYRWLQDDLDYEANEILLFDYRGTTPLVSTGDKYDKSATFISIGGNGRSAENLRGMINAQAGPGERFDIVAHSQGGVVSLYANLNHTGQAGPSVAGKIHGIVTINSPVQGIDALRFLGSGIFTCASAADPSVQDMLNDPPIISNVINRIMEHNWSENKNPFVITIANTKDPLISFSVIGDGLRGVLDAAHQQERRPLAGC